MSPGHPQSAPLWLDGSHAAGPALSGSLRTDIAVVGAGITGLAAAGRLAERGARFVLLERDAIAAGASGRLAGLLLSGLSDPYVRLASSLGRGGASEIWTLTQANHRRILDRARRHSIECDYDPSGACLLAASAQEMKELSESARLLAEDGFIAEPVEGEDLDRPPRSTGHAGGLRIPGDAAFHPAKFLRGLADRLRASGATICENTLVERCAEAEGRVRLDTPTGHVEADVAILAAGAWLPVLCPALGDLMFPCRVQFCATAKLAEPVLPWGGTSDWGHVQFRQTPDGRVIVGGMRHTPVESDLGLEPVPTDDVQRWLSTTLRTQFPAAAAAEITHRWAATFAGTIDGLPLVGPLPGQPRVVMAGGYNGQDLGLGFAMGEAVSDLVLDGRAAIPERFSVRRFL